MKEIFKRIDGVDGYEISNLGRVKSLSKTHNVCDVNKFKHHNIKEVTVKLFPEKFLSPTLDGNGYHHVRLRIRPNEYKLFKVHRLVGKYFLEDYEEGKPVLHKDKNKTNNNVDNLYIFKGTPEEFKSISKLENGSHVYRCNETGEEFHNFKSFCKRNNIIFNRYKFFASLMYKTKYNGTKYSFSKIN